MSEYNELNWKVIESYFKNDHLGKLVRHQLESYNHFIDEDLINTINMFNPVVIHSENDKDRLILFWFGIINFMSFCLSPNKSFLKISRRFSLCFE